MLILIAMLVLLLLLLVGCSSNITDIITNDILGLTDYGAIWTKTSAFSTSTTTWTSIASDSTGQYLAVVYNRQYIYTSSSSKNGYIFVF